MKIPTLGLFTLTAVCSLFALSASAAPPLHAGAGAARGQALQGPPRLAAMAADRLEELDTNNDDKISLEEFLAPRLDRLNDMITRLDKNSDGLISADEIHPAPPAATTDKLARPDRARPNRPGRPPEDREDIIACVQSSNPGFDPPERPDHAAIASRFDAADTNHDGKLSLAELSAEVTARATAQFKRLDKDNDGFLTAADRKAAQAERAALAKAVQACVKAQK